jgi:hypothetical protein
VLTISATAEHTMAVIAAAGCQCPQSRIAVSDQGLVVGRSWRCLQLGAVAAMYRAAVAEFTGNHSPVQFAPAQSA